MKPNSVPSMTSVPQREPIGGPTVHPSGQTTFVRLVGGALAGAATLAGLTGCEVDSYFDPSRTGYFETTPTTMPVLSRLDVVERPAKGTAISVPTPEDLVPGELKYRLAPGDAVRIEIFELVTPGETEVLDRVIDQTGNIPIKQLGDVVAAGLTIEEFQREIEAKATAILQNPIVSVSLERGQGFQFTISGSVGSTGVFALTKPDFRLSEAIALAGGTLSTTQRVKVIRAAPLDDTLNPVFPEPKAEKPTAGAPSSSAGGEAPAKPAIDIDQLINELDSAPKPGSGAPQPAPAAPAPGMIGDAPRTLVQDDKPAVDVDDLTTPKVAGEENVAPTSPGTAGGWTFDAASGRWVRGGVSTATAAKRPAGAAKPAAEESMYATRIIEIDYQELIQGDPNLNVVIRPGDSIYVEPPETGLLYIDGEINRVGVYQLENTNGRLTLSRFVSAAGGLAGTAIPTRVDLVRVVGRDREATIRVDLAAIRNRSEPDIYMQPDDHVIIGTNFFAIPLAVIRNGFTFSYGFGFFLDRNFGNDVFGPPPTNYNFN